MLDAKTSRKIIELAKDQKAEIEGEEEDDEDEEAEDEPINGRVLYMPRHSSVLLTPIHRLNPSIRIRTTAGDFDDEDEDTYDMDPPEEYEEVVSRIILSKLLFFPPSHLGHRK